MKMELTSWNTGKDSHVLAPFCLLFLAMSILFAPQIFAEDTSDSKAQKKVCPHLQSTQKAGSPKASGSGAAFCTGKKSGGCPRMILKKMNLSEEQIEKMKPIQKAFREDTEKLRGEVRAQNENLETLLRSPDAKEKDIVRTNHEFLLLKSKLKDKRLHYALKLRSVLTPEQIQNLSSGSLKALLATDCGSACPSKGKGTYHCPRKGSRPTTKNPASEHGSAVKQL